MDVDFRTNPGWRNSDNDFISKRILNLKLFIPLVAGEVVGLSSERGNGKFSLGPEILLNYSLP